MHADTGRLSVALDALNVAADEPKLVPQLGRVELLMLQRCAAAHSHRTHARSRRRSVKREAAALAAMLGFAGRGQPTGKSGLAMLAPRGRARRQSRAPRAPARTPTRSPA